MKIVWHIAHGKFQRKDQWGLYTRKKPPKILQAWLLYT